MNNAEMRARAIFLASQAGWSDASPPTGYASLDLYWGALINQAHQELAFETEYNVETDTFETVASQAEYTLSAVTAEERAFVVVREAVYSTDTPLTLTSEEEIRRRNSLWLMEQASTPTWFWLSTSGVLRLYPPPSEADVEITLRGPREPAPLTAATDTPSCPQAFHEAIPLKAVLLMAESFLSEEMDLARIGRYEERYAILASKLKRHAGDDDAEVQRYVSPRLPRRVPYTMDAKRGH